MGNRLPKIFKGSRICIICEGDEEYEYLEKLISLDVWSKEYCFQLENAGETGTFLRGIRTSIRMVLMIWFWYFAIQTGSRMSSMWILSERLMNFMELRMQRTK